MKLTDNARKLLKVALSKYPRLKVTVKMCHTCSKLTYTEHNIVSLLQCLYKIAIFL